jgi:hypothetical protein
MRKKFAAELRGSSMRRSSMKTLVHEHFVTAAIEAITKFCEKHKVVMPTVVVVRFTIALREQGEFEWTPCGKGFRRIMIHAPSEESNRAVTVFNYGGFDFQLTKELHELIMQYTGNRWVGQQ